MTTIQLVISVAGFISLLAAIIGGAWLNQRSIEKQMEAFRNEMRAEFASVRAEIATSRAELKGEIGTLRAEQIATREKVDRIDQIFQRLYQPVIPPGKGD